MMKLYRAGSAPVNTAIRVGAAVDSLTAILLDEDIEALASLIEVWRKDPGVEQDGTREAIEAYTARLCDGELVAWDLLLEAVLSADRIGSAMTALEQAVGEAVAEIHEEAA